LRATKQSGTDTGSALVTIQYFSNLHMSTEQSVYACANDAVAYHLVRYYKYHSFITIYKYHNNLHHFSSWLSRTKTKPVNTHMCKD